MSVVHPLLHAAKMAEDAAATALNRLIDQLESEPPQFFSTIAINFWCPYLPSGRKTLLKYPKTNTGVSLADNDGGDERLQKVHHRYLTLLGQNLSANQVKNIGQP